MIRAFLAAGAVAALALTLSATALSRSTGTTTLVGTDGPGYTISLANGGKKVTSLKVGTYKFVIHDKSSAHSFNLDGPHGFAKDMTTVPFKGTKTFTLKLKAGSYKYYCKAHEATMFGHFTVK